jgi:hypothetical protein
MLVSELKVTTPKLEPIWMKRNVVDTCRILSKYSDCGLFCSVLRAAVLSGLNEMVYVVVHFVIINEP